MKIFISSTCYDLKDLRAEVERFLLNKGHTLLLSDRASFPLPTGTHRHDVCVQTAGKCDLFVLVIDSRFGAAYYKDKDISITWAEFREAIRTNKKIIAFVRQEIFNERQSCRKNQKIGNSFVPYFADDIKTFDLIDEVQKQADGIWMQPFENSVQVKEKLENIYDTKHSPLNNEELHIELSAGEIPFTTLSGSTASFISKNYEMGDSKTVSAEILQLAIDKIPENVQQFGEFLGSESIQNYSNEFVYSFPLRHSGDEGEIIMGISPTALGRSVRSELKELVKKIQDEENAIAFFTDLVKRKPVLCRSFKFDGKSYIIGIYEKESQFPGKVQHLCILNLFANTWQIFHDELLDEFDCFPEVSNNCELIIHDKKIYFYFERLVRQMGSMFNGMGVAEFSVFDFDRKVISKLLYQGVNRAGGIEGAFNFELLAKSPEAKFYEYILEQEASKSKYIYRTPKDYNLNDSENYIEKWNIDNPDFYNNENGRVNFSSYDENILRDLKKDETIESYKTGKDHIENNEYLIFFYFAGPILAVKKLTNKYFVILVPQGYGAGGTWGLRSINNVEFLTTEKILAKNDYESYEIDLVDGEYTRKFLDA